MKVFRKLIVLSFSFFALIHADLDLSEQGLISAKAEFLYFKPTSDQPYYVITSTRNIGGEDIYPNGKRHLNHSEFHPGFRLEGLFNLFDCDNLLDMRFTYLKSHHTNSKKGDFLFDTVGFPGNGAQVPEDAAYNGQAKLRESFKYVAADITLNRINCQGCLNNFSFMMGLHFGYIRHKDRFTSAGSFLDAANFRVVGNNLKRRSRFYGIGPVFGADYQYILCARDYESLTLRANGRIALLGSNTKASFRYANPKVGCTGVNIHNRSHLRVTPHFDARISLDYTFCCACSTLEVEIGYELLWYNNAIDNIVGYDVAFAGDSIDLFSNFNLQGPYIAISKTF